MKAKCNKSKYEDKIYPLALKGCGTVFSSSPKQYAEGLAKKSPQALLFSYIPSSSKVGGKAFFSLPKQYTEGLAEKSPRAPFFSHIPSP
jgi:hypothetical protein